MTKTETKMGTTSAYFLLMVCSSLGLVNALSGIELGYSNVLRDTIAGETTLEYGEVPNWLDGKYQLF